MKKEKKLRLKKIKIQSLTTAMDKDEQKQVKGGTFMIGPGTYVPIFC
ncbi:MAG: pinensin family lanthipeptide [Candidatus Aminicenantes bacterium]|jgi:hypothetical protein